MSEYRSFELAPEPEGSRTWLLLIPLAGVLVTALLLFFVVARPGRVEGDSMEPTLHAEERFLGTLAYTEPRRGDVVLFDVVDPDGGRVSLVKRIVAVPGDTILVEGDLAWIDGQPEPAWALDSGAREPVVGPHTLDDAHLFVLGDNRPVALDSREFGPVPLASVKSRVVAVFWPPSRIRLVR